MRDCVTQPPPVTNTRNLVTGNCTRAGATQNFTVTGAVWHAMKYYSESMFLSANRQTQFLSKAINNPNDFHVRGYKDIALEIISRN